MAVGEDVVGADGLTNKERFEMRREKKRKEAEERARRAAMSQEERRYEDLLTRGTIDEQGNILRPEGLNPTEIMRGEAPSWASPELTKNAYIQAFESKARGGQNFMDSGDYQNFLNAGYSLTQDQIDALGGVQNQGSQGGLTFGGSSSVPQPPSTNALAGSQPTWGAGDWKERESYKVGGSTPFLDAYLRSREAATKEGPVSSLFKDMLKGS